MAPTAINDCARRGELHAVARYFKAHADEINSQDDAGRTALHWAALGEVRVVDWLLRHGADGNVLCAHGRNAAHYAALGGKADIANRLAVSGVSMTWRDRTGGWRPIDLACLKPVADAFAKHMEPESHRTTHSLSAYSDTSAPGRSSGRGDNPTASQTMPPSPMAARMAPCGTLRARSRYSLEARAPVGPAATRPDPPAWASGAPKKTSLEEVLSKITREAERRA